MRGGGAGEGVKEGHPGTHTAKGATRHPATGSEVRMSVLSPSAPKPCRRLEVMGGRTAGLGEEQGREVRSQCVRPVPAWACVPESVYAREPPALWNATAEQPVRAGLRLSPSGCLCLFLPRRGVCAGLNNVSGLSGCNCLPFCCLPPCQDLAEGRWSQWRERDRRRWLGSQGSPPASLPQT